MKKLIPKLAFFVIYLGGAFIAWALPAFDNGLMIIFSFVWYYVVAQAINKITSILDGEGDPEKGVDLGVGGVSGRKNSSVE